jgi:hypothetical protein
MSKSSLGIFLKTQEFNQSIRYREFSFLRELKSDLKITLAANGIV